MKIPQSIPVSFIRFVSAQDGPGMSVVSNVRAADPQGRKTRHALAYIPAMRCFQIVYTDHTGRMTSEFVPESRVAGWSPLDEVSAE